MNNFFPGVHSDIGGHRQNNQDIMEITRSWMSENAARAGATYLKSLILSQAEIEAFKKDPSKHNPGGMGDVYLENNPLSWPRQADQYFETQPLNPYPLLLVTQLIARKAEAPFPNQPTKMHQDRRWERYEIDWFVPRHSEP